jgi:hypothetical protein
MKIYLLTFYCQTNSLRHIDRTNGYASVNMAGNRVRQGSWKRPRSRDGGARSRAGRGRPHKFGRPSQVVALTLPNDVLDSLRTLHADPGWAIVRLVEARLGASPRERAPREPKPLAELVHLPGKRGLILVQSAAFKHLRGVSTVPLTDGRAFLAFDQEGTVAQLEVAILDAMETARSDRAQHARLLQMRDIVRGWRRDPRLAFRAKSIILVEGLAAVERGPLAPFREVGGGPVASRRRSPARRWGTSSSRRA